MRKLRRLVVAALATLMATSGMMLPARAADPRIDLKLLLITNSPPSSVYTMWATILQQNGVPFDVYNAGTNQLNGVANAALDASDLAVGTSEAKYQAVILTSDLNSGLGTTEMTALNTYEEMFNIRRVRAYTQPDAGFGLTGDNFQTPVTGTSATVTAAGQLALPSLTASFPLINNTAVQTQRFNVNTPSAGFTTWITHADGDPLVGVWANAGVDGNAATGFEEAVVLVDGNENQPNGLILTNALLQWVTRGVHLGYHRNYFIPHIDDVFFFDNQWDQTLKCTATDDIGCTSTEPAVIMGATDVTRLLAKASDYGVRFYMIYNGLGLADPTAGTPDPTDDNGSVPLNSALLAEKDNPLLGWVNHTYSHVFLGCQDPTPLDGYAPDCSDADTQWLPATGPGDTIHSEITQNVAVATTFGLPINATELVTGEHSGLRRLVPPLTNENPNIAGEMAADNILVTGSDNSVDPLPYWVGEDYGDPAFTRTLPRYPANIYYNAASLSDQVDEYNYIYGVKLGATSNNCNSYEVPIPATTQQYRDCEASIMLPKLLQNDPRPHYFHQTNLIADTVFDPSGNTSVLSYVLDEVINNRYEQWTTLPLVSPTMTQSNQLLTDQANWWASGKDNVTGYIADGNVVLTAAAGSTRTPITGPATATFGTAYGSSEKSEWRVVSGTQTLGLGGFTWPYGTANGAPVFTSVTITPASPITTSVLTVNPVVADPEGKALTLTYQWKKNGANIPGATGTTLNLAVAGNGDKGDSITVTVTATDTPPNGTGSGLMSSMTSAAAVIVNAAPVVTSVVVTPGVVSTNGTLSASATATDADGDSVSLSYQWKKNGANIPGATGTTLDLSVAGNGDNGDSITVVATASDGTATGSATSIPVVVGQPGTVERLAGADRYATAAEISKANFSPGVPVVYVGIGTNFPDALAAGPAAAKAGGPLLLVSPTGIPSVTAQELTRLNPAKIVVVGGTGVVSDAIATALGNYTSGPVERLAGADRYATAAEISKANFSPGVPVVYVGIGTNFPDALAAGPAAAKAGGPLLLVSPTGIPSVTAQELNRLKPDKIVIVGGTGVVSSTTESQLGLYATSGVERYAGSDRYATAAAISAANFAGGAQVVYIGVGTNFPDALAAGPAAAKAGAPLLLVSDIGIPGSTGKELTRLNPAKIVIVGGTGVISDATKTALEAYLAK